MKAKLFWKDGMIFDGDSEGHVVPMDAKSPIGKGSAATPKELVAMGLAGCTAMDVIALLKKYKQLPETFDIDVDIVPSTGSHPIVFESASLTFNVTGAVESEKLIEAVRLSQTKYCGVSAMLSKACPISYRIVLNSQEIGSGAADFSGPLSSN